MSLPINLAGKPIKAKEAQSYIDKHAELKKCLKQDILSKLSTSQRDANDTTKDTAKYFDSEVNAFIFSKETVTRFFEPTDSTQPKAEYLMVIMGAKFMNDDERGNPTVVIAGVNEHPTKADTFLSLKIEHPATEQPPKQTITKFPTDHPQAGPMQLEFKMLL